MFGQDDAVAGRGEQVDLDVRRRAPAHRAGRRGRRRSSAAAHRRHRPASRSRRRSGRASPGASTSRISIGAKRRLPGRPDGRAGASGGGRSSVVRPVDRRQLHGTDAVGGQGGDHGVRRDGQAVGRGLRPRRDGRRRRAAVGGCDRLPGRRIEAEAAWVRPAAVADHGDDRRVVEPPRTLAGRRPSSRSGRCRPSCRSGRSRSGARSIGAARAPCRRPGRAAIVGLTSSSGRSGRARRWRRPSGRPASTAGGWPSRRAPGPRAARVRRAGGVDVDRPDRGPRMRGPPPARGPR